MWRQAESCVKRKKDAHLATTYRVTALLKKSRILQLVIEYVLLSV